MITITYEQLQEDISDLAAMIYDSGRKYEAIYPIPRGGVPVGMLLSHHLNIPLTDEVYPGVLVVDDLVDSGKTIEKYADFDVAVLYKKPHSPDTAYYAKILDDWVEFPYEETASDVQENVRRILEFLGEDPNREGLLDTPKRYVKFLKEFTKKEDFNFTTFENEGMDQMIIQRNIPFFSLCEHHMAPFFGTATVAYIPDKQIVGLSKLARTVQHYAHNLQNQERITTQVAERLQEELNPIGVAVTLEARHFCMEMRGVKTFGTSTVTTKLIGAFKDEPETRAEYMSSSK